MSKEAMVRELSGIIKTQMGVIDALAHGHVAARSREKLIDTTGQLQNMVEELELEIDAGRS